jgi:hypothetical protein
MARSKMGDEVVRTKSTIWDLRLRQHSAAVGLIYGKRLGLVLNVWLWQLIKSADLEHLIRCSYLVTNS